MKKTTVERMYTAKVAELLNQGWHVHTSTMPGHQGEIAHIDLTDGSEIRRVVLQRGMVWGDRPTGFNGHIISIVVGRNTDRVWPGWDSTIWNSHMEVLSEIQVAEIHEPTRRHPEGWYTDMETALDIECIRRARYKAKHMKSTKEQGTAFKSIALRWLRKQPRMKTAKLEDITKMTRYTTSDKRVGFKIEAKGKTFYLHA
ncbi:MAG: hypothetical protein IKD70_00235 [Eggerthellaceae bacterium]|nr:hypothetical protein [Eggerthellaceae bacterium]